MDPETIKDARRIIASIIREGCAMLKSGRTISLGDEQFVTLVEKISGRKLEEPEAPVTVDDFTPVGTHHTKPKMPVDDSNQP